jgi:hypothetical protein
MRFAYWATEKRNVRVAIWPDVVLIESVTL